MYFKLKQMYNNLNLILKVFPLKFLQNSSLNINLYKNAWISKFIQILQFNPLRMELTYWRTELDSSSEQN